MTNLLIIDVYNNIIQDDAGSIGAASTLTDESYKSDNSMQRCRKGGKKGRGKIKYDKSKLQFRYISHLKVC